MARTHYFPADQVHFTWDEGNEPVLTVESGDTVVVHTRDVSDNQITPESTTADIDRLDWDRVYPLAGPIAVEGAEPGDTLWTIAGDVAPARDRRDVVAQLLELNSLSSAALREGQQLVVPPEVPAG